MRAEGRENMQRRRRKRQWTEIVVWVVVIAMVLGLIAGAVATVLG